MFCGRNALVAEIVELIRSDTNALWRKNASVATHVESLGRAQRFCFSKSSRSRLTGFSRTARVELRASECGRLEPSVPTKNLGEKSELLLQFMMGVHLKGVATTLSAHGFASRGLKYCARGPWVGAAGVPK